MALPMGRHTLLLVIGMVSTVFAGCTAEPGDTDSETQSMDSVPSAGDAVLTQLHDLYVDSPFMGGQDTPRHTFLQEDDGRIAFLHWNHLDPSQATGLLFVGDAFRAQGCVGEGGIAQEQIDSGYVHFHKETAANWDQGHHTSDDSTVMGYWFRHIAAAPGVDPMGIGASEPGEVYNLMPSHENAPACGAGPL